MAKMKKLNKADLTDIVDMLASDVAVLVKSEAEGGVALNKADPGEETPGEKKPEGSSLEGSKDEGSSDGPPSGDSGPPDASAGGPPPDASAGPPPDASASAGAPTGDPAADASAGLSPEAIKAEIAHLGLEETKMYFLAFQSHLSDLMTAQGGGAGAPPDASAGAPPPGAAPPPDASASAVPPGGPEGSSAPPPPAGPPAGGPPEMGKGEFDDKSGKVSEGKMSKAEQAEIVSLVKAQVEGPMKKALAEKDAEIESLKKALDESVSKIAGSLTKMANKAQALRKSAAGVSVVQKPGTETAPEAGKVDVSKLNKSEVTAKLREVTARTDLKKSDRDLATAVILGHKPASEAAHLLG